MSKFIYLLNAMESAAQASNPALEEFGQKRRAVLDYVKALEQELSKQRAIANHESHMVRVYRDKFVHLHKVRERFRKLPRIVPSELKPDELFRRNGEYVSFYEAMEVLDETRTEEAPQS